MRVDCHFSDGQRFSHIPKDGDEPLFAMAAGAGQAPRGHGKPSCVIYRDVDESVLLYAIAADGWTIRLGGGADPLEVMRGIHAALDAKPMIYRPDGGQF